MKKLLFIAPHSGYDLRQAPLGGPAPIADAIAEGLQKQNRFQLQIVSSKVLGAETPGYEDFLRYGPKDWLNFATKFERAAFAEVLRHDPSDTVVLCNNDLRLKILSEKGYKVFGIHHMNLLDYVTGALLHNAISSVTAAKIFRLINRSPARYVFPDVLKTTFLLQEESVINVRGAIVPSEGLKRSLMATYPEARPENIHVIPWGSNEEMWDETLVRARADELRRKYGLPEGAAVVIALSRISPEKGQDRLLKALEEWEKRGDFPARGLYVLICGTAGYVQAKPFQESLVKRAQNLKKTKIIFPGYVHGLEKQAHFALADLYVFPSRYESFGLTLLEAFAAGLPAVACHNYGTEQLMTPERGELLPPAPEREIPKLLQRALQRMLGREDLRTMGQRARDFARANPFSNTCDQLVELISRAD